MTDNTNTPDVTPDDNLDDFAAEFFGQNDAAPDTTKSESPPEDEDGGDDALTNGNEVEDADEDNDTLDTGDNPEEDLEEGDGEDESSEDADSDANTKAKAPKKGRFQERIDELTSARRDAERREAEALDRIRKLEEKLGQNETSKEQEDTKVGPQATDKNEDGTDKYPLGEFDPNYVQDLVKYTLEAERKAAEIDRTKQELNQEHEAVRAALQDNWEAKLEPARERYPDFQEKGQELFESLSGIDEAYGEYLSGTLMSLDHGPDVLYHLATNPEEARQIINSGARSATIALGKLEAKFAAGETQPTKAVRTSKAPTPPPTNKGSSAAKGRVAPDTDDLDSFEKEFFKKK